METEEFDRNIDENDEPVEGSEKAITDEPGQTGDEEVSVVDEELEDRGDL